MKGRMHLIILVMAIVAMALNCIFFFWFNDGYGTTSFILNSLVFVFTGISGGIGLSQESKRNL